MIHVHDRYFFWHKVAVNVFVLGVFCLTISSCFSVPKSPHHKEISDLPELPIDGQWVNKEGREYRIENGKMYTLAGSLSGSPAGTILLKEISVVSSGIYSCKVVSFIPSTSVIRYGEGEIRILSRNEIEINVFPNPGTGLMNTSSSKLFKQRLDNEELYLQDLRNYLFAQEDWDRLAELEGEEAEIVTAAPDVQSPDEQVSPHETKDKTQEEISEEPLLYDQEEEPVAGKNADVSVLKKEADSRLIEYLINALSNEDENIRQAAANALRKLGDYRAAGPLIASLNDPNPEVRKSAVVALADIGDAMAIEPLIKATSDNDAGVRKVIVEALGIMDDYRAVDPLIRMLLDREPDVRRAAIGALKKLGSFRAIEPLIRVLNDKEPDIREAAVDALSEIGNFQTAESLVYTLTDWTINNNSSKVLTKFGWQPQTIEERIHFWVALREVTSLKENWRVTKKVLFNDLNSKDYKTIENALNGIIGLGKKESIPELISLLYTKGDEIMAEAFLNCGSPVLNEAARQLAQKQGYTLSRRPDASPVSWGEM